MPDLPSLDGLTSTQLIALLEDAQQAYMAAVERERAEAESARQQLIALAGQLGAKVDALTRIAQTPVEDLTQVTQGLQTVASCLAEVTELARQSVLVGAEAADH